MVYKGYILKDQKSKDSETYSKFFFFPQIFILISYSTINFPITDFY